MVLTLKENGGKDILYRLFFSPFEGGGLLVPIFREERKVRNRDKQIPKSKLD